MNQLVNLSAALFVRACAPLNKMPLKTYQNYIVAVILGLILLVVIIILTAGGL